MHLKSFTNDRCHSFLLGSGARDIFVGRFHISSYLAEEVSHSSLESPPGIITSGNSLRILFTSNSSLKSFICFTGASSVCFAYTIPGYSAVNMKLWNFSIPFTGLEYQLKKASKLNHWNSPHLATVLLFAYCSRNCSNCSMPLNFWSSIFLLQHSKARVAQAFGMTSYHKMQINFHVEYV